VNADMQIEALSSLRMLQENVLSAVSQEFGQDFAMFSQLP
jgi:hypothetical protein